MTTIIIVIIMELAGEVPRWEGRRKLQPSSEPHHGARGNQSGVAADAASLRVKPLLTTAARRRCGCRRGGHHVMAAAAAPPTAPLRLPPRWSWRLRRGCCGLGATPALLKQRAWLWDHRLHIVRDALQRADVVGHGVSRSPATRCFKGMKIVSSPSNGSKMKPEPSG